MSHPPAPRSATYCRSWRWWQGQVLHLATTAALAAILSAGITVGVTMEATANDRQPAGQYRKTLQIADGRYLTARQFTAPDGSRAGRVFAYWGELSWVFVVVQYPNATGRYEVHLVTRDGRDQIIGDLDVAGGQGAWGIAIDTSVAQIAEIRLSSTSGSPLTAKSH